MNFYYDPILGLQYDYLGHYIIMDIEELPKDIDFSLLFEIMSEQGISIVESLPSYENYCKITNYQL